jgi:LysM repeat protein
LKRKCRWTLFAGLVFASCFFIWATSARVNAQPRIHVVEKGDTLWGICEKYYGDAHLWPKLWEMNPFITNPHLLKPGDKITLLEDVPAKTVTRGRVKQEVAGAQVAPQSAPAETGFDVSGLTDVHTLGFFTTQEPAPLGYIFSDQKDRAVLSTGDTVYIDAGNGNGSTPGDVLTVCRKSPMLRDPLTRRKVGYTISILGKVVIREALEDNRYAAEVVESYRTIEVGDILLPTRTISPCVKPVPADSRLNTYVVAVKDSRELIGQSSVVYLANGYNHGVQRGNLLKVIQRKEVASNTKIALPDLVLGYLLVLDSGPETATGVVLSSRQEFSSGALLVATGEEEAASIFSRLPRCTVE